MPWLVLPYHYSSISLFDRPTLAQPLGLETKKTTDTSDPHGIRVSKLQLPVHPMRPMEWIEKTKECPQETPGAPLRGSGRWIWTQTWR